MWRPRSLSRSRRWPELDPHGNRSRRNQPHRERQGEQRRDRQPDERRPPADAGCKHASQRGGQRRADPLQGADSAERRLCSAAAPGVVGDQDRHHHAQSAGTASVEDLHGHQPRGMLRQTPPARLAPEAPHRPPAAARQGSSGRPRAPPQSPPAPSSPAPRSRRRPASGSRRHGRSPPAAGPAVAASPRCRDGTATAQHPVPAPDDPPRPPSTMCRQPSPHGRLRAPGRLRQPESASTPGRWPPPFRRAPRTPPGRRERRLPPRPARRRPRSRRGSMPDCCFAASGSLPCRPGRGSTP
jgi:hypothetical protein